MGTFLVVILIIVLCWPAIKRWAARFMARRAEDFIRNAAGLPPRPGSRRAKREAKAAGRDAEGSSYGGGRRNRTAGNRSGVHEPLIPPEYAEDVEYTESIDYSASEKVSSGDTGHRTWHESQVSDAEWEEIKGK